MQIAIPAVSVKASSLCVSGLSNKIAAGKKVQLTVTFTPSNASNKNVIWTSSNPKVATVNQTVLLLLRRNRLANSSSSQQQRQMAAE